VSEQRAGEYVGEDGGKCAFQKLGDTGLLVHVDARTLRGLAIATRDARAAGEALIALADEIETEYVEWSGRYRDGGAYVGRIVLVRGVPAQVERRTHNSLWREVEKEAASDILAAYRAGLERGRE
jgi:hypothetical protein